MGQAKQLEELEVWQAARGFVIEIYRFTKDGLVAKDYGFRDQLQQTAVSIMGHVAEGHERGGRDLVQCLRDAKGAAAKTRSLLHVAVGLGYLNGQQKDAMMEQLISIARQLGGFIRYLEKDRPQMADARMA